MKVFWCESHGLHAPAWYVADGAARVCPEVPGRVEADVIEAEPIFVRHGADLRRTGGVPARVERYERVGIDVHQLLAAEEVAR